MRNLDFRKGCNSNLCGRKSWLLDQSSTQYWEVTDLNWPSTKFPGVLFVHCLINNLEKKYSLCGRKLLTLYVFLGQKVKLTAYLRMYILTLRSVLLWILEKFSSPTNCYCIQWKIVRRICKLFRRWKSWLQISLKYSRPPYVENSYKVSSCHRLKFLVVIV